MHIGQVTDGSIQCAGCIGIKGLHTDGGIVFTHGLKQGSVTNSHIIGTDPIHCEGFITDAGVAIAGGI